jgi:hypothetical protein
MIGYGNPVESGGAIALRGRIGLSYYFRKAAL